MALHNKNFAKSENGIELIFAPGEFDYNGVHYNASNDEKIYNDLGYMKYIRSDMPEKEGFYYTVYYEKENNVLFQKWKEHEIPQPAETATEDEIHEAIAEGVNSIDQ